MAFVLKGAKPLGVGKPGFLEQNYAKLGLVPVPITVEEFSKKMKTDLERWGPIIKASGAKAD